MLSVEQREAHNVYMRQWKRNNKKKVNASNQSWRERNRDKHRAINRESARRVRATPEGLARSLAADKRRRSKPGYAKRARIALKKWLAEHPGYDARKHAEYREKNPARYMLAICKNRAKKQGLAFDLVESDIVIPAICPVFGRKFEKGKRGFNSNSPSVDRFDPVKGYVRGNVRVISWRANCLKRDATLEELRKVVAYMEAL